MKKRVLRASSGCDDGPCCHKRYFVGQARDTLDRGDVLAWAKGRGSSRIDIEFGIAAVRLNLHEIRDDVGAGVVVAVQHVQAFRP